MIRLVRPVGCVSRSMGLLLPVFALVSQAGPGLRVICVYRDILDHLVQVRSTPFTPYTSQTEILFSLCI